MVAEQVIVGQRACRGDRYIWALGTMELITIFTCRISIEDILLFVSEHHYHMKINKTRLDYIRLSLFVYKTQFMTSSVIFIICWWPQPAWLVSLLVYCKTSKLIRMSGCHSSFSGRNVNIPAWITKCRNPFTKQIDSILIKCKIGTGLSALSFIGWSTHRQPSIIQAPDVA